MTDPANSTAVLERRYRRLLCCYPREHRRAELLLTLLEAAPPGRTRPTLREAANLVRHGLRARLGRPASRSVAVWAVLAATISGLFSAAFAARAGWETAEPLPHAEQTRVMLAEIFPGQPIENVEEAPALFTIYGRPLSWAHRPASAGWWRGRRRRGRPSRRPSSGCGRAAGGCMNRRPSPTPP